MISFVLKKIVGSQNEREIRKMANDVEDINSLEPAFAELTNSELMSKTDEFKQKIESEVGLNGNYEDKDYLKQLEEVFADLPAFQFDSGAQFKPPFRVK